VKILGVNFGHAAAAALLADGEIVAAIEEEKLSRVKGDSTFPKKAVSFVLERGQLLPEEIDILAVGCTQIFEFGYGYRNLARYLDRFGFPDRLMGLFWDGLKRFFPYYITLEKVLHNLFVDSVTKLGFHRERIRFIDHHRAHAASVYFTSPWSTALVVTNDGKGDGLCGSCYFGEGGSLYSIDRVDDIHSIGQFYQSVTKALGFKPNRHEGKITGLAAFGDYDHSLVEMKRAFSYENGLMKTNFHSIHELQEDPIRFFEKNVNRNDFISANYLKSLHGSLMNFAVAYQMYINLIKEKMASYSREDIAAGIQQLAEESLKKYVEDKVKPYGAVPVCLAGGVFANVKINQRIRDIPNVTNVYVHPAMDDSGTSLGAALAAWMDEGSSEIIFPGMKTVYLGPGYKDSDMESALRKFNISFRRSESYEDEIGEMIYEGKIVGRYDGRLEWGPRALGNRSILVRPTDKSINDTLNKRLNRTEFMPFAPAMLDEDAQDFLMGYSADQVAAKYMTITYDVNPSKIDLIQAAVHIDGTARPQVVFEEDNPSFYRIIKAFKKRSGYGVIINTSFNMHEEPIVDTPEQAVQSFLSGAVDVLSMGPFIVDLKK